MDVSSDIGFANCLYHAANLRPGSGCLVAPVCGSFVYMKLRSYNIIANNFLSFLCLLFWASLEQYLIVLSTPACFKEPREHSPEHQFADG